MSYYLSSDKRKTVIAMLCEGMGIRPIERVTSVHRDTIMRLGRDVGEGYSRLHDRLFVNLEPKYIELDEAWSFVFKKQARLEPDDPKDYGDQYSFIAMDADNKAILAYHVGKRNGPNTLGFVLDLANRVKGSPQLTSDGFEPYVKSVKAAFGSAAGYAMLIKEYQTACSAEAAVRYTPSDVRGVKKIKISGEPDEERINTAFVERQNLTLRMLTRRFNRLTNAHSKTLRNHQAAMDLYVGYYNFCWVHDTLGKTPARAMGVSDENWTVERFIQECMRWARPDDPPVRPGNVKYQDYLRAKGALFRRRK